MTIEVGGSPASPSQISELRSNLGVVDFAAGGQSVAQSGTLVFGNSNGLSFGLNADGGSRITASYTVPEVSAFLTTAALSDHSHGNPTLALTGLSGSTASASDGLTISLSAAALVQSVQTQNSVLVQGSSGQITFSASNGVTFGGNAGTVTASVQTNYAASNHTHGAPNLQLTNLSGSTASASNGLTISLSAAAPTAAAAISAAGSSQSAGTVVFSNSNGVSFGMSGSTVTASVIPGAAAGLAAAQAGTQTATSGTLAFANSNGMTFGMSGSSQVTASYTVPGATVFSNSNNVSFGLAGSTVTASASFAQSVQTQGSVAVLGSTGAISFDNSNGITFGGNASTITASHNGLTTAALSNHSHGNPTLALTNLSGTTASASNGLTLSLSAAATVAQTAQTLGVYGSSNTVGQSSSSTFDARSLTFRGMGVVSVGLSGGEVLISAPAAAGDGVNFIAAGTRTATTAGTILFANSNGITFGLDAASGSQVTASYTVPTQTAQTIGVYGSSQTFGQSSSSSVDARSLSLVGSGGVSVGLSAGSILISGQTTQAQTAQSIGVYGSSQTFGQSSSSTIDARSLSVVGSGGVSVGLSAGSLLISGQTTAAQTAQSMGLYASSQTFGQSSSSTIDARSLSIVGSGGVSVGMSAGSLLISGQTTLAQSAQTQSNVQGIIVSDTTYRTGDVSFKNANGISFGSSGANGVSASYTVPSVAGFLTTARASNDAIGLNTAQTNVTWTVNSSGLSFNAAGYAGTGTSNTGAASMTLDSAGLKFNGGGLAGTSSGFTGANISASITHNTAGLALSMSVAAPGGGGGVALSAGTQSVSTGTMVFANSNGVTFGMSGSSQITASVAAPDGGIFVSASGSSQTAGAIVFSNSNGISFGMSGSTITATVTPGAAAGIAAMGASNTTYSSGTVSLVAGAGAITIGSDTGQRISFAVPGTSSLVGSNGIAISTNGSTISVYQPFVSYAVNGLPYLVNSQTQQPTQSTSVVFPVQIREQFSAAFVRMPHTISMASSSFATTANTTFSFNVQETHNLVVYSLGTGASSQSLMSYSSASYSFRQSVNVQENSTTNMSVTYGITYPVSNGTSSQSFSYGVTNASIQISTTGLTALTGIKNWDSQMSLALAPGRWWLAYGVSTASTTQGTNLSGLRMLHSHLGMSQPNNTLGQFGQANAASVQWQQGIGSVSVVGGGTTAAIDLSQVSSSASHVAPYVQFINQA